MELIYSLWRSKHSCAASSYKVVLENSRRFTRVTFEITPFTPNALIYTVLVQPGSNFGAGAPGAMTDFQSQTCLFRYKALWKKDVNMKCFINEDIKTTKLSDTFFSFPSGPCGPVSTCHSRQCTGTFPGGGTHLNNSCASWISLRSRVFVFAGLTAACEKQYARKAITKGLS